MTDQTASNWRTRVAGISQETHEALQQQPQSSYQMGESSDDETTEAARTETAASYAAADPLGQFVQTMVQTKPQQTIVGQGGNAVITRKCGGRLSPRVRFPIGLRLIFD